MDKIKILFVCLGNICRSPSAEGVFLHYVQQAGLGERYELDSAGLIAHHQGERADSRMRAHAARRGYDLRSISRPITYEDFFHYDYIIGMDESNREALLQRAPTTECAAKVSLLTDWHPAPLLDHVPDPYYGGAEGFEQVLDLIESCAPHLLRETSKN
ncbi:MAG: low molecular weight protein-tyrosine-phosphatase [Porphyromonas sp.]|nr:low molecular weight protein-tyrosine-phosphatase [Porphyromonas sp.]